MLMVGCTILVPDGAKLLNDFSWTSRPLVVPRMVWRKVSRALSYDSSLHHIDISCTLNTLLN